MIRRHGTRKVCELTAEALPVWARLKRAARRGDHRLVKKVSAALERLGRRQAAGLKVGELT